MKLPIAASPMLYFFSENNTRWINCAFRYFRNLPLLDLALFCLLLSLSARAPAQVPAAEAKLTVAQKSDLDGLNLKATEAYVKGDFPAAQNMWLQMLAEARGLDSDMYVAKALNNLGSDYYFMGDYSKALDYFNQALEIRKKLDNGDNGRDVAASLNNLGNVYDSFGQLDKALDYHNQALVIRQKLGNDQDIAASFINVGSVYEDVGLLNKALDSYIHALDLYQKLSSPQGIAGSLLDLGAFYELLGQFDKALGLYNQALDIRKKLGNPQDVASILNNMGNVYIEMADFDKALVFANQALDIRKKLGYPQDIAMSLNNLGDLFSHLGQYDKSLDFFTQSLGMHRQSGDLQSISRTLTNMGSVCDFMGQFDKALEYYDQALEIRRKLGNAKNIASTLSNLGDTYRRIDRLADAERVFVESRNLRESLTYQVGDASQLGALQETFGRFYERYTQLLLDRKRPMDALEMLEAGRGQGLARQIDLNHRGDLTRYFTEDERKALNVRTDALNFALSVFRHSQQQAENSTAALRVEWDKRVETARQRQQQAEQEYALFRDSLFVRHPELTQIATGRPALYSQLRAWAREHSDTLYLEYAIVDDNHCVLFALSKQDGLKWFPLPCGDMALSELARKWRDALDASAGRGTVTVNAHGNSDSGGNEKTLAKQGYHLLLGGAEKAGLLAAGRYKRLVFVGSGPILEMPLAALCDNQEKRLAERYPLSSAISLSVFYWPANPIASTASLISISDPTGPKDPTPTASKVKKTGGNTIAARGNNKVSSLFRSGFTPLPGARAEGTAVAGLFPGSKLLVGADAKEETVTKLLPDYSILHFATHGFIVPRATLSSGLVLAEETAEGKYDGLLTARKIMNLPLSAQLAVLSACDTGRGTLQGGEGLQGLAWAFRAAGCPSLLASQWQVNDAATKEWMLAFYHALKAGKPKDEAVRAAMLAVKKDHASPYYWAAFELIGDAGPLVK